VHKDRKSIVSGFDRITIESTKQKTPPTQRLMALNMRKIILVG